jgi:ketosteroid isomerase-like protein
MSQENVERVRAAIEAWNRGDLDAALTVAAPDLEVDTSSTVGEWRGVHRGRDAARRLWQTFFVDPWESVRVEIDEVIEADDHVVTRQTGHFVGRDGIEVTNRTAWCWTFRDGELSRLLVSNELDEALEAAGLRK